MRIDEVDAFADLLTHAVTERDDGPGVWREDRELELGGCPLASAASLTSSLRGTPRDAVYVRKDAMDHGSKRLVEGDTHLAPGAKLVIVEDVTTTGGSTLKAVAKLRAARRAIRAMPASGSGWTSRRATSPPRRASTICRTRRI